MYQGNMDVNHNVHILGVSFLSNFLDRVGFTIIEVNTDPRHHFQLLARIKNKSFLIAVRTARHPGTGAIDNSTLKKLVHESEERDALPHFAGLSVLPAANNNSESNGLINGQEHTVIFSGIRAVRKSELLAVNG